MRDVDVLGALAADRFTHGAQRGRKGTDIVVRRHIAGFEMDFGDPGVIAGDQPEQDFGEIHAGAAVDAPHDAEIDDPQSGAMPIARRDDEQIALVHVGMEKALGDRLRQKAVDEHFGKLAAVEIERG